MRRAGRGHGAKDELKRAEDELAVLDRRLRDLVLQVPSPADPTVPDGGEDDGEVLRVVGDDTRGPTARSRRLRRRDGLRRDEARGRDERLAVRVARA